jgi:nicotinate dehydrogenase subunit B
MGFRPSQDPSICQNGAAHALASGWVDPGSLALGHASPSTQSPRTLPVWTHTQGVFALRAAIADLLDMPQDKVHCIQVQGSGCYGHNGADDAGADAALLASLLPGRPIRVQWMREQEHGDEPLGPVMLAEVRAALDVEGNVVDWHYDVWSNTHNRRPNVAGLLIQNAALPDPRPVPPPAPIPMPEGGGDRNSNPIYAFGNTWSRPWTAARR